jgi:hypothetical protein
VKFAVTGIKRKSVDLQGFFIMSASFHATFDER